VVCILYVVAQLLLPGQDAGIDFARKYELAKGSRGGGQSFERPPPSPAAVRGDGLAALPGGAQRGRGSGPGGLQINEPGISRSLKTLTGSWSELALACLIHVGMKRLMPNEDSGLGIGAEYEEAVRLHRAGGKTR
jgi:hypothetical protein